MCPENSTFFFWETDFDGHLQTTGSQQGLVNHITPIRHTNNQNVVQLKKVGFTLSSDDKIIWFQMASLANLIDSVDFREKLIDDCVVDTGATRL